VNVSHVLLYSNVEDSFASMRTVRRYVRSAEWNDMAIRDTSKQVLDTMSRKVRIWNIFQ
jgi:hypothetical protein